MPSQTFDYTGSEQTWDVPSGLGSATIRLYGAGTGNRAGGYVEGELDLSSIDMVHVFVGGRNNGTDGGWPNGGNGRSVNANGDEYSSSAESQGGAGETSIRTGGTGTSNRRAVAGGAGGDGDARTAGYGSDAHDAGVGGRGGASTGEAGGDAQAGDAQADGGAGGGSDGSDGTGGDGASQSYDSYDEAFAAAGGGAGGGHDGGDGGRAAVSSSRDTGSAAGGGGAGSNYDGGLSATTANTRGGGNTGNGQVVIEYTAPPATPNNVQQDVEDDDTTAATWAADTSGGPIEEYDVEISTDGGSWTRVATTSGTSHTETIARATDTVQFRVRSVNSAGASDWVTTTTESTNVSGLQITSVDADSIGLSWDDPTANDGTDVLLAEASGSAAEDYSVDQSVSGPPATIADLEHGERYYARVQATYDGADGTPSPASNEVAATIPVPAPTLDSLDASSQREVTLNYTLVDNSTDGDVLVERSTDGQSWSEHATIDDLSATTWTDTGLLDGERYWYRLVRRTDHASAQSGTLDARTPMPNPTDFEIVGVDGDQFEVEMRDRANHKDGYRVYRGPDGSLSFDGDYVSLGTVQEVTQEDTSSFSIVTDVTPRAWTGTRNPIIGDTDSGLIWGLMISDEDHSEPRVRFFLSGSDGYLTQYGTTEVMLDEPIRIAVVYEAGGLGTRIYVDGEVVSQGGAQGTVSGGRNPTDISIGRYADDHAYSDIHSLAISGRALSSSEIGTFGDEMPDDPAALYHFNQGSGPTLIDYSGNGNHGTLQNSPTWHEGGAMVQDGGDLDSQYAYNLSPGERLEITSPSTIAPAMNDGEYTVVWREATYSEDGSTNWPDLFGFNTPSWRMELPPDGVDYIRLFVDDTTSSPSQTSVGTVYRPAGEVYSGAFAVDATSTGGEVYSYKNGTKTNTTPHPGKNNQKTAAVDRFTMNGSRAADFDTSRFDFYSRVLSDVEIEAWHNGDYPTNGLEMSLRFGEGPDGTPTDSETGNAAYRAEGGYESEIAPITHTTENLKDGERYVLRGSAFTEHTGVFDQ